MDFVTDQIAVGSRADAEDGAALLERGIDTLLSLAPVERPVGIARQLCLDIRDRQALAGEAIDEAVAFLQAQAGRGRRILVHCEMGISRSPAVAAAYLHAALGLDLEAALAAVRRRRPVADPHPALVESLGRHYGGPAPVDLSGNENPLGPSPLAVAAVRRAAPGLHRYPDRDGAALRGLLGRQLGVSTGEIVLGNGSCELIDSIARACLGVGGEALIPAPAFPAYAAAVSRAGGRVVPAPMPGGRYVVEEILTRLTPATRLVIIASPHNPTGSLMARADLARLQAALPAGAWLLLDEAYRDYAPPGELPDLLPAIARGEPVIVLRTLSKLHGLAGLRLGYAIAPEAMAKTLLAMTQQYNTSALAQVAAAAALGDAAHQAASRAANAQGLEELAKGLIALGVEHLPSAANFILLRAGEETTRRLAERGIQVKDMDRYGLPGHIRVSVGRPADNARFLAALADICGAGQEQTIHA